MPNIQRIFSEVPRTYEGLNHALTFGQDILWRREVARMVARHGGRRWLDACSGTGELTALLARAAGDNTLITTTDFSVPMVREALKRPQAGTPAVTIADVSRLPFSDNRFDALTISFATRNLNSAGILPQSLAEFRRVLKPGGLLVILETSQPKHRLIRCLFHLYVGVFVGPVGRIVSGSGTAYAYLSESMRQFFAPEELSGIIRKAGFGQVSFRRKGMGAAAIHQARK